MTGRSRRRGFALWFVALMLGAAALAGIAIATTPPGEAMDPDGVGPVGGAALLAVLERNGVQVEVARSAQEVRRSLSDGRDGRGTSVVVSNSRNLGSTAASSLRAETVGVDHLVALSPTTDQIRALGSGVTALAAPVGIETTSDCQTGAIDEGDALAAIDGRYQPPDSGASTSCFPLRVPSEADEGAGDHGAALVEMPATDAHAKLTIVGTSTGFGNRAITEADNAAIALRLLGGSPRLIWYHPGVVDLAEDGPAATSSIWPTWMWPTVALLGVGVIVLALVRGRRLGGLVREPLPVVVRAIETTESRGRLYRRAQDRPRAAAVLRLATLDRLRSRLRLRRTDPLDVVARATSAATGMPVSEVLDLVAGADPTTDADLVQLAQDLSELEEKAHHP